MICCRYLLLHTCQSCHRHRLKDRALHDVSARLATLVKIKAFISQSMKPYGLKVELGRYVGKENLL